MKIHIFLPYAFLLASFGVSMLSEHQANELSFIHSFYLHLGDPNTGVTTP
jgi:hypothetical protein